MKNPTIRRGRYSTSPFNLNLNLRESHCAISSYKKKNLLLFRSFVTLIDNFAKGKAEAKRGRRGAVDRSSHDNY